jgi:hypothetical protein
MISFLRKRALKTALFSLASCNKMFGAIKVTPLTSQQLHFSILTIQEAAMFTHVQSQGNVPCPLPPSLHSLAIHFYVWCSSLICDSYSSTYVFFTLFIPTFLCLMCMYRKCIVCFNVLQGTSRSYRYLWISCQRNNGTEPRLQSSAWWRCIL